MKLDLNDLQPTEAQFELSTYPGKAHTLKKFSLAVQVWIEKRFGKENVDAIFSDQRVGDISEIIYFMLKDKIDFPSLEVFQESIVTQKDRVQIYDALFKSIGISQPILEKLSKEAQVEGNAPGPTP